MDSDEVGKEVRWHGALLKRTLRKFTNSEEICLRDQDAQSEQAVSSAKDCLQINRHRDQETHRTHS